RAPPGPPDAGPRLALLQHGRPLPGRHACLPGGHMIGRGQALRPFASSGRRTVAAILATFAFFSAVSVGLSVWSASRSKYKASVLEVAARQRTLAERYVKTVLL